MFSTFPEINYSLGITKLTVDFKADSFYPQIRKKYFTMIDWFSFVGGILGLFFGFSILSAFEVVFHVWMLIFDRKSLVHDQVRTRLKGDMPLRQFQAYLREFLKNSSIHSFQYISNRELGMIKRFKAVISSNLYI